MVIGLSGCSYLQSYVDMATDRGMSAEYQAALDKWTRSKTVHSQFQTRVKITATLKSVEFNRAYLKEYARIYQKAPEEIKKAEAAQASLASDFTEFVFYAYTPDKDDNDFDRSNSIWSVFIIDGQGNRIAPLEIRRIDRITAQKESFYPYVRKYYGNFYSLKFRPLQVAPLSGDGVQNAFRLIMVSTQARVELQW